MRQSKRTDKVQTPKSDHPGKIKRGRQEMNRFLRRFLVFVLLILLSAICIAGYATLAPISIYLNAQVLNYHRDAAIDYEVVLKPNNFTEATTVGMDQVYIQDFSDSVNASFDYAFSADRASNLKYSYTIDAIVRVHDASNPDIILLSHKINLRPETVGQINGTELVIKDAVSVKLADYTAIIESFKAQTSQPATFDVAVTMVVSLTSQQTSGLVEIIDTSALQIPLQQPQFEITRVLPDRLPVAVHRLMQSVFVITNVPFVIILVLAGLCLLLLILLLTLTRGRKKNLFNRQLHRMMRQAKSRLMVIGDKAWEPEWCVTATDYHSLVRTAKKLKHPIFCFVDRQSPVPTAYFYIYYGENNYCFTFTGEAAHVDTTSEAGTLSSIVSEEPQIPNLSTPSAIDDRIPLLPETDDSSDIFLAKLMTHPGLNQR